MKTLLSLWRGEVRNLTRVADVAARVAEERGVPLAALRGPRRSRPVAHARHAAFAACRAETRRTLAQIGAFFGDRDRTTVLDGIRAHERRSTEAQP